MPYPENILEQLRQRDGLEKNDTFNDNSYNELPANTAFDECCTWYGLIGYGPVIRGWIKDIYGIELH